MQALNLQLPLFFKLAQPNYHIVWRGSIACIWAWEGASSAIPETLYFLEQSEGLYCLALADGFEGQYWREGILRGSRWWHAAPNNQEWINFQRSLSLQPTEQRAEYEISREKHLPKPWGQELGVHLLLAQNIEILCYGTLLMIFVWLTFAVQLQIYQLKQGVIALQVQNKKMAQQAHYLLEARQAALDGIAKIHQYQTLQPPASQLNYMAVLAQALPANATLKEWEYHDGSIRIVVQGEENVPLSRAALVEALRKQKLIESVISLSAPDNKSLAFMLNRHEVARSGK